MEQFGVEISVDIRRIDTDEVVYSAQTALLFEDFGCGMRLADIDFVANWTTILYLPPSLFVEDLFNGTAPPPEGWGYYLQAPAGEESKESGTVWNAIYSGQVTDSTGNQRLKVWAMRVIHLPTL